LYSVIWQPPYTLPSCSLPSFSKSKSPNFIINDFVAYSFIPFSAIPDVVEYNVANVMALSAKNLHRLKKNQ
jgi:hypothetical protein